MNIQSAEQSGRSDDVEKLAQLSDIIMNLVQESQPPEIQLINRLMSVEYPNGTQMLLDENRQRVNPQLLEIMQLVEEDLIQSGREEVARRLTKIREQAATMAG